MLERLALSRSGIDRQAERRGSPELIGRLRADPTTRVLILRGDQALVAAHPLPGGAGRLWLGGPEQVPDDALVAFLGSDGTTAYVLAALPSADEADQPDGTDHPESADGQRWAGLRELGTQLNDLDAGLLTMSLGLASWHRTHPRCSRCGAPTEVAQSGWSRHCPECGAEHYPRTDPAVIMAVVDVDDRLLLGRQSVWPEGRFSTLAGFVEPGESLEDAVRREVLEEAGVVVGDVTYQGSQPWPFPASLMLAYRAAATSTQIQLDESELAQARWWTRDQLSDDVAAGELILPPPVSVARRLIEDWFGGPIDATAAWR